MIRRYPKAFFHAFFTGALFWILADVALLGWLPFTFSDPDLYADDTTADFYRYLVWMMVLVFLQTPLAGALATSYLGQAVFEQEPSLSRAIQDIRAQAWSLVWNLGFKRLAIPTMILLGFRWGSEADVFIDGFLPFGILIAAALVRSNRPFLAEMILLERCPIRSEHSNVITLKRRSKALHTPMASELGGRFLTVAMTLLALLGCVHYSLVFLRGIALNTWEVDLVTCIVFYPLSLWMVASLSVIVRLLSYLDARIRLEGWEVELAIRAEAIRQFGDDFISTSPQTTSDDGSNSANELPPPSDSTPAKPATPVTASTSLPGTLLILFAITLSGCVLPSNGFALDQAVSSSVWFNAETGEIQPIEVEHRQSDTDNRDSRWNAKPKAAKATPAANKPTNNTTPGWFGSLSLGNVFGWLLLLGLLATVVGVLVYVFSQSSFEFSPSTVEQTLVSRDKLDQQTKQRIAELPAELRDTNVNPRTELERLMESGDFDQAIIFLYGHQLLMLDRAAVLRLSRWKTNNQYVREARHEEFAGKTLAQTVGAFERSYFGRHSIAREQFDTLWKNNLALEQWISTRQDPKS